MQPSALIQPHAAALPRSSLASLQCKTASRLQRQQSLGGQGRKVAVRAEAEEAKTETAASPSPPKPTLSNSSYAYTGIKTDTTGISVVDVIEPSVYVSASGPDAASGSFGLIGGGLALTAAAFSLVLLGGKGSVDSGPSLTELSLKFESEVGAPSSRPIAVVPAVEAPVEAPALKASSTEA